MRNLINRAICWWVRRRGGLITAGDFRITMMTEPQYWRFCWYARTTDGEERLRQLESVYTAAYVRVLNPTDPRAAAELAAVIATLRPADDELCQNALADFHETLR